ncbi:MAG: MBOAT family protein [Deltaproteobacteria bacterium]|nr:MBOAT family protein [Deltaproteobacteria bacterium]
MSFISLQYALFFTAIFVVFWALRRRHLERTVALVVVSAWFYTRFDYGPSHPRLGWTYLAILFCSAVIDFGLSQAIHGVDTTPRALSDRTWGERRRKRLLLVSIVYNLGVLAWFKYTNFGLETARHLLEAVGVHVAPRTLQIVLPIGISFFTFETMSYTIDVYRRELVPPRGRGEGLDALRSWSGAFLEYLLFISFFPHLVAGPIIRPKDMLPQLRRDPELNEDRASEGLFLIAAGLLKKVVIADYLALNHVDRVFDRPEWFSAPEALAAVYGYALQIYCDFSGYTDIALGSALLLGIVLPKNFDSPYKSRSLQEFWHRWHISLSSWLRDYLYIPLGGSHGGPWKTYRNLMITMLLGGLWHGASWNFVVWGALHGAALSVTRMWQRRRERPSRDGERPATRPTVEILQGVLTFHYVCLAWIFFRADGFARARMMLRQIAFGGWHVTNLSRGVVLILALGFVTHLLPDGWYERARRGFVSLPAPAQGALMFLVALVVKTVASTQVVPFVYFQF